jgi:antitoxin (DNA-binding transcriptional repressor) of toxin-antitoxin stability system
MGIRELRQDIGRAVDEVHWLKQPKVITKNGADVAALIPHEWLVELEAYRAKYGPFSEDAE